MFFIFRITWKQHTIKVHKKEASNWKCRYCSELFNNPQTHFKHYSLYHEKGTFACTICCHISNLRINISNHIEMKHSLKNISFLTYPKLSRQEFLLMKIISLNCFYCLNEFSSEKEICFHIDTVHQNKKHACFAENCKLFFNCSKELKDHTQHAHNNLKCVYCSKTYSTTEMHCLKLHISFYHQNGQFECTLCKHRPIMNTRAAFKEHCNINHNINDNQNLLRRDLVRLYDDVFKCLHFSCNNSFDSE